ncbi:hypothetical protein BH18ACI1_BH18ACI1_10310 [soil metagenome]
MNNLEKKRERYMQDALPIRLGGLAANLARIGSFVKNSANLEAVKSLLAESKYFIEWTAAELSADKAFELVRLQIELAVLERNCEKSWSNEARRMEIGVQAKDWSKSVLQTSGLIGESARD